MISNSISQAALPAILAIAAVSFHASAEGSSMIYTYGHGDIGVAYGEHDGHDHDGDHGHDHDHGDLSLLNEGPHDDDHDHDHEEPEFHLHYHLGADSNLGEGEHAPGEITVQVADSLRNTVGADAMWGTSGPDSYLWVLPASNQPDVPFLGIATEGLHAEDFGDITFSLDDVHSPSGQGHFSLWQTEALGDRNFFFSTANEGGTTNGDNTLIMAPGLHDHFNYGFTEPGHWEITLTASGTHVEDGFLSDTATFEWEVIPEPAPATLLGLFGLLVLLTRRRR